jgi:hypothetical protein
MLSYCWANADQPAIESRRLQAARSRAAEQGICACLSLLGLLDRNDPICELVARKIIEIYGAGTHDPERLAKLTVTQLGPKYLSVFPPSFVPTFALQDYN